MKAPTKAQLYQNIEDHKAYTIEQDIELARVERLYHMSRVDVETVLHKWNKNIKVVSIAAFMMYISGIFLGLSIGGVI